MDEHSHDIDDLFQKAAQRHSELPTNDVWEQLEKNLQKRKVTSITKQYKKWKWVAAALFIFSVALGIYALQLTVRYKKDLRENKPDTSNRVDGNDRSSWHTINQKTAEDSMQKGTGRQKNFNEPNNGVELADDTTSEASKNKIDEKASTETGVSNYDNNKIESTKTGHATAQYKLSIVAEKNNNRSLLNKTNAGPFAKGTGSRKTELIPANEKINRNINEASSNNTMPVSPETASTTQANLNAVSPEKENTNIKASLIYPPLYVFTGRPSVMPYDMIDLPSLVNNPAPKGAIRLKPKSLHPQKFIIGLFYSKHIVSTDLKVNRPDFREDNYLQIKNHEKNRVSAIIGLSLAYKIAGNLQIASGLSLATYVTDISNKSLVARKDLSGKVNYRISTSSGYAYYTVASRPRPDLADSLKTLSSKSTVKYVTLPLGLQYSLYLGRFGFTPGVLLNANFKSSGKIKTIQSLEHTYAGNIEGLKSTYFDVNIGFDIGYYVNKTVMISLIPSGRMALSPATGINPVSSQRKSVGLAAGLNFAF